MAKVMVSIPDELLERIDEEAARTGRSRSGLLQFVMRLHVMNEGARTRRRDNPRLKQAMERAQAILEENPPKPGIDSTELIRRARDSRFGEGWARTGRHVNVEETEESRSDGGG